MGRNSDEVTPDDTCCEVRCLCLCNSTSVRIGRAVLHFRGLSRKTKNCPPQLVAPKTNIPLTTILSEKVIGQSRTAARQPGQLPVFATSGRAMILSPMPYWKGVTKLIDYEWMNCIFGKNQHFSLFNKIFIFNNNDYFSLLLLFVSIKLIILQSECITQFFEPHSKK